MVPHPLVIALDAQVMCAQTALCKSKQQATTTQKQQQASSSKRQRKQQLQQQPSVCERFGKIWRAYA